MDLNRTLLVCLILAASAVAAPNTKIESNQLVDISHVDFSGRVPTVSAHVVDDQKNQHEFKAPYFNAREKPLPREMKAFSDEAIIKTMKPGKDIIDASLIKGRNKYLLTPLLGSIAFKFFFMAMEFEKRSKELKKKYSGENDEEFQQRSMKLLPELISKAKGQMKEAESKNGGVKKYEDKKARKETGERIILLLDGIQQLVLNSPVGTHLDFTKVTVDGEPMNKEAVEHLKFMSKSGLGWVVDLIDGQCNKIMDERNKNTAADYSYAVAG